jgi:hypothetical protein
MPLPQVLPMLDRLAQLPYQRLASNRRSDGGGSRYAGRDVVAESGVDGQVHAQLGDPAVERMPGASFCGVTPQKRFQCIDRLLPQVQPVPNGANYESEFEPDGSSWQFYCISESGVYLLLGGVNLPRRRRFHQQHVG